MARADFNVRAGKVAWRYTAAAALFFGHGSTVAVLPSTARIEKMLAGYPNRSLLRRGLDTCSTSQSIHTTAMPRPMTTPLPLTPRQQSPDQVSHGRYGGLKAER